MRRALVLLALVASSAAPGCGEDEDPLGVEALQGIGRSEGDALGDRWDGAYLLSGEAGPCDCPVRGDVELCGLLGFPAANWPVQVFHLDGRLAIDIVPVMTLYGRVDADGEVVLAAIRDAGSLISEGELLTRVEGAFDGDALAAEMIVRLVATYGDEAIDCTARSTLSALRF